MVKPTWEDRDLPVVRAVVEEYEANGGRAVRPGDIVSRTGFDVPTVQAALRALRPAEPPYFTKMDGSLNGGISLVGPPTPEARRAVGLWPTPQLLADRLIDALAQAADDEPDEERRGWLKNTAIWLGTAGRDLAVQVAATALTKQAGLS